jgi:hypothetical protein
MPGGPVGERSRLSTDLLFSAGFTAYDLVRPVAQAPEAGTRFLSSRRAEETHGEFFTRSMLRNMT